MTHAMLVPDTAEADSVAFVPAVVNAVLLETGMALVSSAEGFAPAVKASHDIRTSPDTAEATAEAVWPLMPYYHVESVSVEPTSLIMTERGQQEQLTAVLEPEGTTNRRVVWSSSNESVATVTQDGLVTARTGGEAIITARTADDGHSASCVVAVNLGVTTIQTVPDSVVLDVGNVLMLNAVMYPADAHDMRLDWETNNYGVASVIDRGRRALVHAYSPGYATIKATCREGGHEATCAVVVTGRPSLEPGIAVATGEGVAATVASDKEGVEMKSPSAVAKGEGVKEYGY